MIDLKNYYVFTNLAGSVVVLEEVGHIDSVFNDNDVSRFQEADENDDGRRLLLLDDGWDHVPTKEELKEEYSF